MRTAAGLRTRVTRLEKAFGPSVRPESTSETSSGPKINLDLLSLDCKKRLMAWIRGRPESPEQPGHRTIDTDELPDDLRREILAAVEFGDKKPAAAGRGGCLPAQTAK